MQMMDVNELCGAIDHRVWDLPLTNNVMDVMDWLEDRLAADFGRDLTLDETATLCIAYYAGMIRWAAMSHKVNQHLKGDDI